MAIKELDQDINRPPQPPGPLKWIRDNLFNGIFNSILTIILFPAVLYLIYLILNWVFTGANWRAVAEFPLLFAVGQYPRDQIWRVGAIFSGLIFMLGVSWGRWGGLLRMIALGITGFLVLIAVLPVQHSALTVQMRLYLGGNLLFALIGFLIGKKTAVKEFLIIIFWFLIPIRWHCSTGRVWK